MNVAAFIFALVGAGLNLFQPIVGLPIPGLNFGASLFDIVFFLLNMLTSKNINGQFIVILIVFVALASIPATAVKSGIDVLQRKQDTNAVRTLKVCAIFYTVVALIVFLIPHFVASNAEQRMFMQYGMNNVIPFTTPLIWAACYAVAAVFAHTDKNSEEYRNAKSKTYEPIVGVETDALIKRGNIFLEENDFEQAERYFEQAINQSPENSKAYLGKLMAELKVHDTDGLSKVSTPLKEHKLFQRALSFANEEEKRTLESYVEAQNIAVEAEKQAEMEQTYIRALELKEKISSSMDVIIIINLLKSITPYKDSEALIIELEQIKRNNEKKTKKKIILGFVSIVVFVVIVVCISKYLEHRRIAQEHAEQQRIEQSRIEAEKNEEKSRIDALKLELQGQK
ncbi:MAG: hypothetical protein IJQ99_07700 [Synergistaceae bacterium]|nr:hypothetical protein [Synergistaceae bacterium]